MMAVRLIRLNDPQAFKGTDLQLDDVEVKTPRGTVKTVRGCRCRRSKCQKKYCECFGAGLRCSDNCICEDCENGNEPGAQPKPRPAAPAAAAASKSKAKAAASASTSRPPVAPKGTLSASQTAKVGMLVASARPAIPAAPAAGASASKTRKRNLSVHVPNSNLHAKATPSLAEGREPSGLGSALLFSAGASTGGVGGVDTLKSEGALESARSIGSLGGMTPTAAGLSSPCALQWGQEEGHPSMARSSRSPVTRNMSSGLGGAPSPLTTRGTSGLSAVPGFGDRGVSGLLGLDRGMSGIANLERGISALGSHPMSTRLSPKAPISPVILRNVSGLSALARTTPPCSPHAVPGGSSDMPEGPPDAAGNHDVPPDAITPSGRMRSVDFQSLFA